MEVTVLNGQSLFDLAVQAAGSVEAVFGISPHSPEGGMLSITDELPAGMQLNVPVAANRQIADYYRTNGILPATGITANDAPALQEGVEFWAIEYDFIVS
jgi:hypothetical protein